LKTKLILYPYHRYRIISARLARWILKSASLCSLIGTIRLKYFIHIKRSLIFSKSEAAFNLTIKHNLRSLCSFQNERMKLLIDTVTVIEKSPPNIESKVLVIGCRNELDLLRLFSNGFSSKNIRGLDLIKYSPMVDCGDMHNLPYPDSVFDIVLCGWTLSYSRTPDLAAKEIERVTKPGGLIGVSVEYCSDQAGVDSMEGYSISEGTPRLLNSSDDLLRLFHTDRKDVFFINDAPLKLSHSRNGFVASPSNIAVIFSCRK
jgi:SAM-dependent methyltransferase